MLWIGSGLYFEAVRVVVFAPVYWDEGKLLKGSILDIFVDSWQELAAQTR